MSLTLPPDQTPSDSNDHHRLFGALTRTRREQTSSEPPAPPKIHLSKRTIKRVILGAEIAIALILLCVLTLAIAMRHDMRAALPQLDGNLTLAGLSAPVTVTRDAQGVPSITAANLDDLLFAQGFVTAQDRLWQMDILRRHAAGDLAEILGASQVEHDRIQRYLQIRTAAERALTALPQDQVHQLAAYARGVNSFIETRRDNLPVEFHLLHYTPAPWSPRDSLLIGLVMSQDLSTSFPQKLNREAFSQHLPANLLADLYPNGSWRDRPPTKAGLDLTTPTDTVLQIPLDKSQSRNDPPTASPADLLRTSAALGANRCDGCRAGSNNWAVSGAHSASGAPLLSNDMHLGLTAPDIWYEAALHTASTPLNTPLDIAGLTLPGVPLVIVGRNANVAWGFTNTGSDVQDLRIEHLRGSGANTEYERPDGTWALAGHRTERIRVRAGSDVTLDILTTSHNVGAFAMETPIISPLHPTEKRALSLAWNIYDPAALTSPFLAIDTAPDAASLVAAFASFGSPSENLVFADAHHIGFHVLGRVPIRGPAIQRSRTVQPFIMPDRTPESDDEDEDTGPSACLQTPHPHLLRASWSASLSASWSAMQRKTSPRAASRAASRTARKPPRQIPVETPPALLSTSDQLPTQTTTAYTIGSPIAYTPVDALDPNQVWSGYIPYNALPSVLDPASGILATANARVTPDNYPYFLCNDWADPYRVERIHKLLEHRNGLRPADMLSIEIDTHSEFNLLLAQRVAYALDHASSSVTHNDPRLHQAADLLRDWKGGMTVDSPAAAIAYTTHQQLWLALLLPQIERHDAQTGKPAKHHASPLQISSLYTWDERSTALEQLLLHTPARWLPPHVANWDDLLAGTVLEALKANHAPANLKTWTYGSIHPVEIAHPVFGSHGAAARLLGLPTGTGLVPNSGDGTTVKQAGLHFGPSERFTADLANPQATILNITTGESGNPASPWFLDQFLPWLHGTTFHLPLQHPATIHTLTLSPK
jgi:penicillin amidase